MLKRAMLGMAALVFAASAGLAAPQAAKTAKSRSWSGIVTDSKCAMNAKARTDKACIEKCVAAGEKYVLYDTFNHKVYQLDPQSEVAEHAAHHVRVYGTMEGDTIHVTKVTMMGMMKKKAASPGL
jgi:hypothetical protein